MSLYDDLNPAWQDGDTLDQPGWEPWEPDEEAMLPTDAGCAYCGHPDVRDRPDPFGQQPCCDGCFNELIGGDRNDPPWTCTYQPSWKRRTA